MKGPFVFLVKLLPQCGCITMGKNISPDLDKSIKPIMRNHFKVEIRPN